MLEETLAPFVKLTGLTSYARALKAAIARNPFQIDGLRFVHRPELYQQPDYVTSGRHTMVFELAGTGKQYRVMIEPVQETHR
jgi:hypothetical protein